MAFSATKNWTDNILKTDSLLSTLAKQPGPFHGKLFGFELKDSNAPNIGSTYGNYKNLVKASAGVFVLRDGFRVRMGDDWLNLGKEWTSGGSYYGLRPVNTVGFIAISSAENSGLIEKSDREGFTDNAEWQGFEMITECFKDFANGALATTRRAVNDFLREMKSQYANNATTVDEKIFTAGETVRAVTAVAKKLECKQSERDALKQQAKAIRAELRSRSGVSLELSKQLTESLDAIEGVIADTDNVQGILANLAQKQNESDIEAIQTSQEQLKNQVQEVYDIVATGIAAEGLMHEITPLLQEVNAHLDTIKKKLKNETLEDASVLAQLNIIREINNTVQQRVEFINPMMRTFREFRSDISLLAFLKRYFENRMDVLTQKSIKWYIDISEESDLIIRINQGRLIQVIDNIVRNSEYWLARLEASMPNVSKEIHVERQNDSLIFWDTGKGVRSALKNSIFEIFVTDKPSGEGHGLGLFIVSQLLTNVGCSISLGPELNNFNNRYRFIIDFTPIVQRSSAK